MAHSLPGRLPRALAAAWLLAAVAGCPAPAAAPSGAASAAPAARGDRTVPSTARTGGPKLRVTQDPREYQFFVQNSYGKITGFLHPDDKAVAWKIEAAGSGEVEIATIRVTLQDGLDPGAGAPSMMFPPGPAALPGAAPDGTATTPPAESPPPALPDTMRASPPAIAPDEAVTNLAPADLEWPNRFAAGDATTLVYYMDAPEVRAFVEKNYLAKALGAHGINVGYAFRVTITLLDAAGQAVPGADGQPFALSLRAKAF